MIQILILFSILILLFLIITHNKNRKMLQENNLLNFEINKIKSEIFVKNRIINDNEQRIYSMKTDFEEKINNLKEKLLYVNDLDLNNTNLYEKLKHDNKVLNERLLNIQDKNSENIKSIKNYSAELERLNNDLSDKYRKISDLELKVEKLKKEKKLIEESKKIEKFNTKELDISIYEIEKIRKEIIYEYKDFLRYLNKKIEDKPLINNTKINFISENILSILESNKYIYGGDVSLNEYVQAHREFLKFHKENLRIIKSKNRKFYSDKVFSVIQNFPFNNYNNYIYSTPNVNFHSLPALLNRVYINEDYINLLLTQLMISIKSCYPEKISLTYSFSEKNKNFIKGIFGEMYCKKILDDKNIQYINYDLFKLDLFGFSYGKVHSNYFDYQYSEKFDLESASFVNLINKCLDSCTCPYGEIKPCSDNVLNHNLNAYLGVVRSHCANKLTKFVNIEDFYKKKEKFILINSKISLLFRDASNNSLKYFPELSEYCKKNNSVGRIDFFCMDDNEEPYCIEVKVNSSKLSLAQEFRLGVLAYFGFKSKIFKVKIKEFEYDNFINYLDTEGVEKTFKYLEMNHELVDFIPSIRVKNYIQQNIETILRY